MSDFRPAQDASLSAVSTVSLPPLGAHEAEAGAANEDEEEAWSPITVDSEGVILGTGTDGAAQASSASPVIPSVTASSGLTSAIQVPLAKSTSISVPISTVESLPISTSTASSSLLSGTPVQLIPTAQPSPESILDRRHYLFPLGITAIVFGGILALSLPLWLCWSLVRKRHRHRHHQHAGRGSTFTFSHSHTSAFITPYPFDAKAFDDPVPDTSMIDPEVKDELSSRPASIVGIFKRVPSFYHQDRQTDQTPLGPDIEDRNGSQAVQNTQTGAHRQSALQWDTSPVDRRLGDPPAGAGTGNSVNDSERQQRGGGSPVPSFQTDRIDDPPLPCPPRPQTQIQRDSGIRTLTPPKAKAKDRLPPPPLIFSPSIDQWTQSVRGSTPGLSTFSSDTDTETTLSGFTIRSSTSSLYVPPRAY